MDRLKLIRITTVPQSLHYLLQGQLKFIAQYYDVIGISSDGEFLKEINSNENIKVIAVEMTRTISPFKDLKALWQIYKTLKQLKPFIVHTHTPKAGTIGMIAARLTGVPYRLHTVAGLPLMEATGMKRKILDLVEKMTYSCATKIYPNSKGLYNFILEHKFAKAKKLKIIGNGSSNGINTAFFSPGQVSEEEKERLKQLLGILPGDFVFVFVGRMVGDKGINELIAAFKNLKVINQPSDNCAKLITGYQLPITKLLLVGPFEANLDPLRNETLKEIETNPNIISVGFQPDVRPYFAIADTLVFPSYREGFPNVVMQAGAMELPSIVTDINGCNEIIVDGGNGIIIPPKDTEALSNAMLKLLNDMDYYNRLKQNARRMITERYEQHKVWEAILAEYKSLEKIKGN